MFYFHNATLARNNEDNNSPIPVDVTDSVLTLHHGIMDEDAYNFQARKGADWSVQFLSSDRNKDRRKGKPFSCSCSYDYLQT